MAVEVPAPARATASGCVASEQPPSAAAAAIMANLFQAKAAK